MGYPVNPDGSFDYDRPLELPTTLTDERAGYDAPSEAALEATQEFTSWLQSCWAELSSDEFSHEAALRFDAFAAQAVAAREAEIVTLTKERDELKANKERLWDNARELGEVMDEVAKGIMRGDLDREYWQGKKDGLRLSIALLHPDKDLEGVWISSLQSSHHAMFLEVEEKVMDRAKQTRRERLSESMRKYREQQATKQL